MKIINYAILLTLLVATTTLVSAQTGSSGKLSILEGGVVSIFGRHDFTKGSGLIPSGKITTARTGLKGYVSFAKGSSWEGASEVNFVDGYVRVSHSEPFVFPVGDNNKFRPVAISGGAKTVVAFYDNDPTDLAPVSKDADSKISNKEFWDIKGDQPVNISFSWGQTSNIANLTDGVLENLQIVGLKNGEWSIIPSKLDEVIPDNLNAEVRHAAKTSSFSKGVISSAVKVVPNDYDYFTLGKMPKSAINPDFIPVDKNAIQVYPNPVENDLYLTLPTDIGTKGTIKIYNSYGVLVHEEAYTGAQKEVNHFDMSNYTNGIYDIYIRVDHKEFSSKFVVQRLY